LRIGFLSLSQLVCHPGGSEQWDSMYPHGRDGTSQIQR
jgi:hypothetical protein